MRRTLLAIALTLSLPLAALASHDGDSITKVNGSVTLSSGDHAGTVRTVNGDVDVGTGATVDKASTVNGEITLDERASAGEVNTVNGGITLEAGAKVSQTVHAVNGAIVLHPHSDVHGSLSNVNGEISLDNAHVGEGISTVNGDLTVDNGSHVEGGILVDRPHGNQNDHRHPRIVIGPHAVVQGTLEFRRDVDLYVSNSAQVGEIKGATAQKFSGSKP